jgi:flagellar biosynthesis GTPase FlhF
MQNDSDKKKEELAAEDEAEGMAKTENKKELSKEEAYATKDREKELRKAEEKAAKEKAAQEKADREKAEKEKEAQAKLEKEKARIEAAEAKKAASMKEDEPKSGTSSDKSKEESAEPPAEGGRGKSLNPLKWFRGSKSPKEEPEVPGEKKVSVRLFDPAALDLDNEVPIKVSRGFAILGERGRYIQAPAVQSQVPAGGGVIPFPVEDFEVVMEHPEKQRLLTQMRLALQEVAVRGNVLFRDIANDYISVINELSVGKTKGVDEKLKALRKRAVESYVKACAVQDHLDWYEATQSTRYSGLFEDFLTLPDRVREELPPRNDPISKYLDEVEALLGR